MAPASGRDEDLNTPELGISVRRILVHLVEEIARHAGHADIIRELIDGTTGTFPWDG